MKRRTVIKGLSTLPVLGLVACKSERQAGSEAGIQAGSEAGIQAGNEAGIQAGSEAGIQAGSEAGIQAGSEAGIQAGNDQVNINWAAGETSLIEVDYPNDSIFDTADSCELALSTSTTKGPCYFKDETGEDISLGLPGLPMQLCLKVVDEDCQPLSNHTIEVWHCDIHGVYSGDTSESSDANGFATSFCTGDEDSAAQSTWYRGQLVTDEQGRVNFKSQFPGWYPGRTVHIHFAVSDAEGNSRFISQFCFTDELADEIYANHPLYSERGVQDTPLSRDGVFPRGNRDPFIFKTDRNSDGSLLAYQMIKVL